MSGANRPSVGRPMEGGSPSPTRVHKESVGRFDGSTGDNVGPRRTSQSLSPSLGEGGVESGGSPHRRRRVSLGPNELLSNHFDRVLSSGSGTGMLPAQLPAKGGRRRSSLDMGIEGPIAAQKMMAGELGEGNVSHEEAAMGVARTEGSELRRVWTNISDGRKNPSVDLFPQQPSSEDTPDDLPPQRRRRFSLIEGPASSDIANINAALSQVHFGRTSRRNTIVVHEGGLLDPQQLALLSGGSSQNQFGALFGPGIEQAHSRRRSDDVRVSHSPSTEASIWRSPGRQALGIAPSPDLSPTHGGIASPALRFGAKKRSKSLVTNLSLDVSAFTAVTDHKGSRSPLVGGKLKALKTVTSSVPPPIAPQRTRRSRDSPDAHVPLFVLENSVISPVEALRRRPDHNSASPVPSPSSALDSLENSFSSSSRQRQNPALNKSSSRSGSPFLEPLNFSPGSANSSSDDVTPTGRANQLPKLAVSNVPVKKWRKSLDITTSGIGADGEDSGLDAVVAEPGLRQVVISPSAGPRRDSSTELSLKREDSGAVNKQLQDIYSSTKEKKPAWKKAVGVTPRPDDGGEEKFEVIVSLRNSQAFDDHALREEAWDCLADECTAIAGLRHPSIAEIENFVVTDNEFVMIQESLTPIFNFFAMLKQSNGQAWMPEKVDALAWALALASALDHIHNALGSPLVHRGVCPAALFLTRNKVLKLGDFKDAVFIFDERKDKLRAGLGDPRYAAPETMSTRQRASYDTSCDVFSAAMSIFFVCTTVEPFADCAPEQAAKQIKAGRRPNASDPGLVSVNANFSYILSCMWDPAPQQRPLALSLVGMMTSTATLDPLENEVAVKPKGTFIARRNKVLSSKKMDFVNPDARNKLQDSAVKISRAPS